MSALGSVRSLAGRLRRDRSGLAMMEFAFTMPLILTAGMLGMEAANLALVHLRISQITLALADNASRVGDTPLTTQQLREGDINDVLLATKYQGASIDLTTRGRVIISSLENVKRTYSDGTAADTAPVQRIHWQRCIGQMGSGDATYRSAYGPATPIGSTGAGTNETYPNRGINQASGMGPTGAQVNAPSGGGVIFVEINYNYRPLMADFLIGTTQRIHYEASFIVRDNRDFAKIYNPVTTPLTVASTCDLYTKGVGGATS